MAPAALHASMRMFHVDEGCSIVSVGLTLTRIAAKCSIQPLTVGLPWVPCKASTSYFCACRCNDINMEFKAASMARSAKDKTDHSLASREAFKARGVEHAFALNSQH